MAMYDFDINDTLCMSKEGETISGWQYKCTDSRKDGRECVISAQSDPFIT